MPEEGGRVGTQGRGAGSATSLAREPHVRGGSARALTRGVAIAAAALATAATVSSAAAGLATDSHSRVASVGNVTRAKGHVTVGRGIPVVRKANLRGGDLLSTSAGGEANVTLKLKRFDCTVWSNTQIRVRPARSVGYEMVGRTGDVACGTLSRSRQTVSVRGPESQFTISMNDPIFSIAVRQGQAVVKVARGVVVVSGRLGRGTAVLVARGQQTAIKSGGDPLSPQKMQADAAGARRVRTAAAPSARVDGHDSSEGGSAEGASDYHREHARDLRLARRRVGREVQLLARRRRLSLLPEPCDVRGPRARAPQARVPRDRPRGEHRALRALHLDDQR